MASGNTLLILHPFAASLVSTAANFPQFHTIGGANGTSAEVIPVLAFDGAGADETCDWYCVLPRNYAGGGLTCTFYWSSSSTDGDVVWQAAIRRVNDQGEDLDTTDHAYAYNLAAATTVPATQGHVDYVPITFTDGADMDSLAAGEYFIFRVMRDSGDAGDTEATDAYLHMIEIRET